MPCFEKLFIRFCAGDVDWCMGMLANADVDDAERSPRNSFGDGMKVFSL
jgi:hypothetical protein